MKECIMIHVNCFKNKSKDIDCEYIGFNFYVEKEKSDEMMRFIQQRVEYMKMPLDHICFGDEKVLAINQVWNKEKIIACLEKHEEELVKEYLKQNPKSNIQKR